MLKAIRFIGKYSFICQIIYYVLIILFSIKSGQIITTNVFISFMLGFVIINKLSWCIGEKEWNTRINGFLSYFSLCATMLFFIIMFDHTVDTIKIGMILFIVLTIVIFAFYYESLVSQALTKKELNGIKIFINTLNLCLAIILIIIKIILMERDVLLFFYNYLFSSVIITFLLSQIIIDLRNEELKSI